MKIPLTRGDAVARAFLLREGDSIRVMTPFLEEFKEDLKAEIPYSGKRWDADGRGWIVSVEYEDTLRDIVERYFEATFLVTEADALRRERAAGATIRQAPPQPPHDTAECGRRVRSQWPHDSTMFLQPGAPQDLVIAAYRVLSKIFHPDVSGRDSTAEMAKINMAYTELSKRFAH